MNHKIALILAGCLIGGTPALVLAHGGDGEHHGKGRAAIHNVSSIELKSSLDSANAAATDLAAARAKLKFSSHQNDLKGFASLKVDAKFPIPSPSLGITDAATAAAAQVHIEISRGGAVIADCSLAFDADHDHDGDASAKYQLRLRSGNGSTMGAKGSCPNGLPAMMPGDSEIIYGLVGGARANLLDNQ